MKVSIGGYKKLFVLALIFNFKIKKPANIKLYRLFAINQGYLFKNFSQLLSN